jgi:hypothetical protein
MLSKTFLVPALISSLMATSAYAACAPQMRVEDVPKITPNPSAKMVSHTERFVIPIAAAEFNARLTNAPLAKLLPGTPKIAAVSETRELTATRFGAPNAPRVVCLADGGTAVEESMVNEPGKLFQYKVWNYSVEVAKPIEYGVGSFELVPIDATKTTVVWTYSFKLRDNTFPGFLGPVGRWIFKKSFMEGDYAQMMAVSAKAMSEYFR